MEIVKIEKGMPIPDNTRNKRFPFSEMNVGDSILYSESGGPSAVRNACTIWRGYVKRNKLDWEFTVRKTDEGTRIWRVK